MAQAPWSEAAYRVYRDVLAQDRTWTTAREVGRRTRVNDRTVRGTLHRLVKVGVFEQVPMFGGYRYRVVGTVPKAARVVVAQLDLIGRVLDQDQA